MAKFFVYLASLVLVTAVCAQNATDYETNPLATGSAALWGLLTGLSSLLAGPNSLVAWILEGARYLVVGLVAGVNYFLSLEIGLSIQLLLGRIVTGITVLVGILIGGFQGPSA